MDFTQQSISWFFVLFLGVGLFLLAAYFFLVLFFFSFLFLFLFFFFFFFCFNNNFSFFLIMKKKKPQNGVILVSKRKELTEPNKILNWQNLKVWGLKWKNWNLNDWNDKSWNLHDQFWILTYILIQATLLVGRRKTSEWDFISINSCQLKGSIITYKIK